MSLRAAVQAETKTQGPDCAIFKLRQCLKGAALAELDEVLADRDHGHAAVARGMTLEYKQRVTSGAVAKHRNGECSCGAR